MRDDILVATERGLHRAGASDVDLEDLDVIAVTTGDRGLWALVEGRVLHRREDNDWRAVGSVEGLTGRCLLAVEDTVLVGTSDARLLRLDGAALTPVQAFDRTPGRDEWYTPWGGSPDTRSLAAANGTLYANVHVGGIPRSRDGGVTWEPTIDIGADVHQVLVDPQRRTVLAACAVGLASSADGGETWSIADDGLHGRYCRAVAVAGDAVLVSASTGPFSDRAAVYQRDLDAAGSFERCTEGLPEWFGSNIDTHCLAALGQTVALGTSGGDVYRSDDSGRTWERVAAGLSPIRSVIVLP